MVNFVYWVHDWPEYKETIIGVVAYSLIIRNEIFTLGDIKGKKALVRYIGE